MIENKTLYKVSAKSNIKKVSEAIYKAYLEDADLEIQCVGAGAVNQSVKALAISRSKLSLAGIDIAIIPGFRDIPNTREEGMISAINFRIVKLNAR